MSVSRPPPGQMHESATLIDLLDRVLDKGIIVAGDISVSLTNIELLTIRIRLLVCSIDKAEQIGLNWWRYEPAFTGKRGTDGVDAGVAARLEARIDQLERRLKTKKA